MKLGVDVGSTTVKVVVLDEEDKVLYTDYQRHHAEQAHRVKELIKDVNKRFPNTPFRVAVCGSGARPIADAMHAHYVQEVVANATAIKKLYPATRTAIELGGQDAKIIFFYYDPDKKQLITTDMRMNGSCAGGTGAFIDEIASLLKLKEGEFEQYACKGTNVHEISGRCGVFAKTDIQSLLNSGVKKEDIALSAFHAIVKQTIGGLAQGLELKAPIIFEGGPLTFDPTLVKVFKERLELKEEDVILPEMPETIVARGAALSVDELFNDDESVIDLNEAIENLGVYEEELKHRKSGAGQLYFNSKEEEIVWRKKHATKVIEPLHLNAGDTLKIYIGIDAGSTTSKLVFMNEDEEVIDSFYANNQGDPLRVVCRGLKELYDKYSKQGVHLEVLGLGTTGYGEMLIAKGFGADYHTVETVAHANAASKYQKDVSFILDIGGQDMKAIWIQNGIVTNITLNEACSSGCGSFLENFAKSLGIPVEEIADAAFSSTNPAKLGSRCTVFMNSTVITEQKNGHQANDIMAGLCRSIIENVFTKVVRIPSPASLGTKVVVQGGTFKNDAVLRALEQYLNVDVTRSPYPGEMGAIGAALLAKKNYESQPEETNFIGFENLDTFYYTRSENNICQGCANRCNRSIVTFSNGENYITGNRCPRGEQLEDDQVNRYQIKYVPDMFLKREALLFKMYPVEKVCEDRHQTIGLPRTLEFWDSMPFWTTFFRALGYDVKISSKSSRKLFESGLQYVSSDTVCFPAKLCHGHIKDLANKKVDRIFMPMIMQMPNESKNWDSKYVCAVVKGYPLIIRNSENPSIKYGIPFDKPMFHWLNEEDRKNQIIHFAMDTYGIRYKDGLHAFKQAEEVLVNFRQTLMDEGQKILNECKKNNTYAVVLAGRPYHTDPLVSHDLSRAFTKEGVAVLTLDSLPELHDSVLRYTIAEVTNNFHSRMLGGAMVASKNPNLEYVQIVSFGCGHDAILSDEITRIMNESGKKSPLILKLDEGSASNSIHIRVKSFLETVNARRIKEGVLPSAPLQDAYPVKFYKEDIKTRVVFIPNVSVAFCRLLSAVLSKLGIQARPLPLGTQNEIKLAKKYVHNDICFPAQMCIGEAISALQKTNLPHDQVAIGMAKYAGDCRLSHYSALLRRGMDAAGFKDVPIVSTDPVDTKEMHPGVKLGMNFEFNALWVMAMMDVLEELRRKIRPYEIHKGETNKVFDECIDAICEGIKKSVNKAMDAFRQSIERFKNIEYDRSVLRPRVFITGEYLVTFHPGSNFHIEEYLEANGMEVILPRMVNVFRKDYLCRISEIKDSKAHYPLGDKTMTFGGEQFFKLVLHNVYKEAYKHPLTDHLMDLVDLAKDNDATMDHTFISGEGWLIPGEIREYARDGVSSFVILQPFGCLPNHICGRGVMKKIKEEFPSIQLLALDLDPDTSFANVENRLQMLIMNEKTRKA